MINIFDPHNNYDFNQRYLNNKSIWLDKDVYFLLSDFWNSNNMFGPYDNDKNSTSNLIINKLQKE